MSIYVFLILGTFWNRAVFIDVAKNNNSFNFFFKKKTLIGSSFLILAYFRKMSIKLLKYLGAAIAFSWVLDLAWIIIYTKVK